MNWKQIDTEWWRGTDKSGGGWIRLSGHIVCNGKFCQLDTNECGKDKNIERIVSSYIGWRDGCAILYWFPANLAGFTKLKMTIEKQLEG